MPSSTKNAQTALLTSYRAQEWDVAQKSARAMAEAHPALADYYAILQKRILTYRDNPPAPDWDGHYNALAK